jgi:hypothetical protein
MTCSTWNGLSWNNKSGICFQVYNHILNYGKKLAVVFIHIVIVKHYLHKGCQHQDFVKCGICFQVYNHILDYGKKLTVIFIHIVIVKHYLHKGCQHQDFVKWLSFVFRKNVGHMKREKKTFSSSGIPHTYSFVILL